MKYIPIIFASILFGCVPVDENTLKAKQWIKAANKPVVSRLKDLTGCGCKGRYDYTLQSSDNEFYSTGTINISLPDTIK